jgi:flagellar basal-body rod protein FlgC
MFDSLDVSSSALRAQRTRMDVVAANVAGMNKYGNAANPPYRRRFVVFDEGQPDNPARPGVRVSRIEYDRTPFREVHEPGNPMADKNGNVLYPNVDLAIEMVNALEASRAYEANVTAMEVTKAMINASLRLLA